MALLSAIFLLNRPFFLTQQVGGVDKTDEGIFRCSVEEEIGHRCLARRTALIFMAAVKYLCYK